MNINQTSQAYACTAAKALHEHSYYYFFFKKNRLFLQFLFASEVFKPAFPKCLSLLASNSPSGWKLWGFYFPEYLGGAWLRQTAVNTIFQ